MVGMGNTYKFTPNIDYKVTIDRQVASGNDIKLGAEVKIKFLGVMGDMNFYIENCVATQYADGTGKNVTLVENGCVGDKTVSRKGSYLCEFYVPGLKERCILSKH